MNNTNPSNDTSHTNQRLEIEDADDRLNRLQSVLMQLDSKQPAQGPLQQGPRSFDFGDRSTFAIEPPSALLSRVQAFLPELAASNAQLELQAQENPKSVDIENVNDGEAYIQMKLGLGVFESRATKYGRDVDMPHTQASSSSGSGSGSNDSSSSDDTEMSTGSDSDSDSDSDASSIDIISAFTSALPRPIRPLPRRSSTRPGIVVLEGGSYPGSYDTSSSPASGDSRP
ncbi:hypothetical protein BXZ70DRAFT_941598 [Cristinia sonorae]|uniref:Uncharacterized protein n=1 Tax=Cristinia sonorae TaxID=1940300 RepID=A0A8K0UN85_9AGAR|nr:hypothetical protein BXZ70DRAFT_941598 [Cristinia sonorae]